MSSDFYDIKKSLFALGADLDFKIIIGAALKNIGVHS